MRHKPVRNGDVWTLHHGGKLVAELVVTGLDWPWVHARVVARPGFDELRPLFDEEFAYSAVRDAVTMRYPDGRDVAEFLLQIDGDVAWWRSTDASG